MKSFTTSIFVPEKAINQLTLLDAEELKASLNKFNYLSSDECHGAMDDLEEREEFILFVNGQHHRHEIKMRVTSKASGKARLVFVEPNLPEVKRFAEWRVASKHLISMNRGAHYQLRNFSIEDLRRMIRHSISNKEKQLVTYR